MGAKKEVEPMGLAELRERFKYASTSQVVGWEPSDVASMRLTLEALVEVYEATIVSLADIAVDRARKVKP